MYPDLGEPAQPDRPDQDPQAIGIRAPTRGTIAVDAIAAAISAAANGRNTTPALSAG